VCAREGSPEAVAAEVSSATGTPGAAGARGGAAPMHPQSTTGGMAMVPSAASCPPGTAAPAARDCAGAPTMRQQAAAAAVIPRGSVVPDAARLRELAGRIDQWYPCRDDLKLEIDRHQTRIPTEVMFRAVKRCVLKGFDNPYWGLVLTMARQIESNPRARGLEDQYDDDLRPLRYSERTPRDRGAAAAPPRPAEPPPTPRGYEVTDADRVAYQAARARSMAEAGRRMREAREARGARGGPDVFGGQGLDAFLGLTPPAAGGER
jgi:hypothetical protein